MVDKSSNFCSTVTTWRKVFRRIFILSQLALAIYYSNNAITSWNDSPVVTSVKLTGIENIQFPAVTICYDINEWKWPGIVQAMSVFDKDDLYSTNQNFRSKFYNKLRASDIMFKKSQEYKKAATNATAKDFIQKILPKDLQPLGLLLHYISYFEPSYKMYAFMKTIVKKSYDLKVENRIGLYERSSTIFDLICSGEISSLALKYCSEINSTLDIICEVKELNEVNEVSDSLLYISVLKKSIFNCPFLYLKISRLPICINGVLIALANKNV